MRIAPVDAADPGIAELLYEAVGGDRSRPTEVVRRYRQSPAAVVLAMIVDDDAVGVAGFEARADRVVLLHIATRPRWRRRGIGGRLLREVRTYQPGRVITAETDGEAVGFYLAAGFTAVSLGEKYPGVERFEVRWSPPPDVH